MYRTATTRGVVAAFVAVLLVLPAAVPANSGGGTSGNAGGGATYGSPPTADGDITLKVASGAWLGRATRIRGMSANLAGRTVSIERRRSSRSGWVAVASVRVGPEGRFGTKWTPRHDRPLPVPRAPCHRVERGQHGGGVGLGGQAR